MPLDMQASRKARGVLDTATNLNSAPGRFREQPAGVNSADLSPSRSARARKILSPRVPTIGESLEKVRKRYRSGGLSL